MKLLVVASDRMEFSGILAHAPQSRPASAKVDWARTVTAGADEWLLVANGAGVARAAAAAEAGLNSFPADALVSAGYCGALLPELEVADIVVATEVTAESSRYTALPVRCAATHRRGVVRTSSRVAQSVEERRSLRAGGADVVDMEASAVAECARIHGLPFYCVKVVTDLARESMANDFNNALREDGHFDTIILLVGVLRHPFARMPELLRLRSRTAKAARALGDFLADCRF